jgi:hypothetical protein
MSQTSEHIDKLNYPHNEKNKLVEEDSLALRKENIKHAIGKIDRLKVRESPLHLEVLYNSTINQLKTNQKLSKGALDMPISIKVTNTNEATYHTKDHSQIVFTHQLTHH